MNPIIVSNAAAAASRVKSTKKSAVKTWTITFADQTQFSTVQFGPIDEAFTGPNQTPVHLLLKSCYTITVSSLTASIQSLVSCCPDLLPLVSGRRPPQKCTHVQFFPETLQISTSLTEIENESDRFAPLADFAQLAFRLSPSHSNSLTNLGVTWDHALTDVGGMMLLLNQISHFHRKEQIPPLLLDFDRVGSQKRALSFLPYPPLQPQPQQLPPPPPSKFAPGPMGKLTFEYSAEALEDLKTSTNSRTRHVALFTSVANLLSARTVSISASARGKVVPANHCGNSTVIVRSQSVEGIQNAIEKMHEGLPQTQGRPCDVHFTSWWHALSSPDICVDFSPSKTSPVSFEVGEPTNRAASMIAKRSKCIVCTVMPGRGGGGSL